MSNRARAEAIYDIAIINRTSAKSILSSTTIFGLATRLDSIYTYFPKFVMSERNRHRGFSLSDRSSRAVPPEKLIIEVRSGYGLAMPAKFKRRIKGMGGGEELTGDELIVARLDWIEDALVSTDAAERALFRDEAKETVNRRLDWCIYAHSLQTATHAIWMNFLGLRLANADPTIEVLAQKCYEVYKATEPKVLKPGQWHLPFTDEGDHPAIQEFMRQLGKAETQKIPIGGFVSSASVTLDYNEVYRRLSAGRCAHLSFNDLETGLRMTLEKGLTIYDKLVTSLPMHASPPEHQATPDEPLVWPADILGWPEEQIAGLAVWHHEKQRGNFAPGWRQARKMIPGEAVAPLPEGYSL